MNYLPLFIPTLLETQNEVIINFAKLLQRLQPAREEIEQLAHEIYESEGCPEGKDLEHWLQAEVQLLGHRIHEWLSENGGNSSSENRTIVDPENIDIPDSPDRRKTVLPNFPLRAWGAANSDTDLYSLGAD
jgi:hypothetical protein